MLQAMNTGHDGSMSTIHANTTRDALTRIENMVQMGNMGLPARSIRQQIVGAVDLIVQVERHRDGERRVTQVTEVCGMEGETSSSTTSSRTRSKARAWPADWSAAIGSIVPGRVSISACRISGSTAPGPPRSRRAEP